jgi:hypothetical protein
MTLWAQTIVYILAMQVAFTNSAYAAAPEGFSTVDLVPEFKAAAQSKLQNGIFKIQIGDVKNMHGTAYLITSIGQLLTNVHNVKSCLDEHGLAKSGYDGSQGDLECKSLTLKNANDEILGPVKLVASYPYSPASGIRIEVAVIKSSAPRVLSQIPLEISEDASPAPSLFAVGYAGTTSRSVRAIAKMIRNLNRIMQLSAKLESEIESVDTTKLSASEIVNIYMTLFSAAAPLASGSNEISKVLFPEDLSKWFGMKTDEVKTQIVESNKKIRPKLYSYIKMLESLKFSQYKKGYIKTYPDADNGLKVAREITHSERYSGIWILRGDGRPGSSGSPVVDSQGVVHGILFAIALISNDIRFGCTADLEFSDWESGNYSICNNTCILMVGADLIRKSLKNWRIKLN